MREVGGRQRLRCDTACLEQLERDLACRCELRAPPDHEHAADERQRSGELVHAALERRERLLQLVGGLPDAVRHRPAGLGRAGGQQGHRGDLGRVCLGRRDRILRTGRERQDGLGHARERRLGVVRHADREGTASACVLDVFDDVRRSTGLRESHHARPAQIDVGAVVDGQ
jgi:hypothetical protein